MRAFLRLMLFVVAGPIVGFVAGVLAFSIDTLATTESLTFSPALLSPGTLIGVYSVGLLPSLVNGIAAIFIARRVNGLPNWLWMAVVGAVSAFPIAVLLVIETDPSLQWTFLAELVSVGAVSAFVCAALFDALSSLAGKRNRV